MDEFFEWAPEIQTAFLPVTEVFGFMLFPEIAQCFIIQDGDFGQFFRFGHFRFPFLIRIGLDARPPFEVQASSIVVANGQYFGGGMWLAPPARMDDGFLEVKVVGDVSRIEVLINTQRLYRGTLSGHPKVQVFSAQTISLESEEEVLIDMDGELVDRVPVRFEMLPKKIKIIG